MMVMAFVPEPGKPGYARYYLLRLGSSEVPTEETVESLKQLRNTANAQLEPLRAQRVALGGEDVQGLSRGGEVGLERRGPTRGVGPLGAARGIGPGPQLTALEAIERLEPSLDIEEEQPHVLHWQTKKPSVAREEFGGHGVGSTTKGKGGKCFKCQQVGHWAAECPN